MQKHEDAVSAPQLQLQLDFGAEVASAFEHYVPNVVVVDFSAPRRSLVKNDGGEQALIEQILQNAQRLTW